MSGNVINFIVNNFGRLAIRAKNADFGPDHREKAGYAATIPANTAQIIYIPVNTQLAGKARFQASIAAGKYHDSCVFSIPVNKSITSESYVWYGELEQKQDTIAHSLHFPQDCLTECGGLEVTLTTSIVQLLGDTLNYLTDSPYETNEHIASKIIALATLQDVIEVFRSPTIPKKTKLRKTVLSGLRKLKERQKEDGSFSLWGPDHETQ
jgi:uncharacterized protein YfaS (alpha-2-macroglobulin family)